MFVFLDTEFTNFEEPYLISAGLVAGDRELYFEVAGVSPAICSDFAQKTVLPQLNGPALEPIEIAQALAMFLLPCGPQVTFFCDAPRYDITLLLAFLPARLQWGYAVPSFESFESEQIFQAAHQRAFASGLRRHHALDDARALATAWASLQT
jgi:hypothetical protein